MPTSVYIFRSMGYTLEIGLPFASLYWISAVLAITLSVLYGKARVIVPKFDAELAWKLFDKYRVSLYTSCTIKPKLLPNSHLGS